MGYVFGRMTSGRPVLQFSTKFGTGVSLGSISGGFQNITGTDSLTGFEFIGKEFINCNQPTIQTLDDGLGTSVYENAIETLPGPLGPNVNALNLRMTDSNANVGGVSQDVFTIEPGEAVIEFYWKYALKLPASFAFLINDGVQNWMTITSWKTGGLYNSGQGVGGDYRAQLVLNRLGDNDLYWVWQVDTNANGTVPFVTIDSGFTNVPDIVADSWVTIEHYTKRSNSSEGVIWWKVDGTEVGRYDGPNYGVNFNNVNRIFPFLNYSGGDYAETSGVSLRFANFEFWTTVPS